MDLPKGLHAPVHSFQIHSGLFLLSDIIFTLPIDFEWMLIHFLSLKRENTLSLNDAQPVFPHSLRALLTVPHSQNDPKHYTELAISSEYVDQFNDLKSFPRIDFKRRVWPEILTWLKSPFASFLNRSLTMNMIREYEYMQPLRVYASIENTQ